jgi:SAM-dependent methyltransferase
MDPAYERDTLAVEETHWWYRGRRRIVADALRSLALPPGARILDAGCGSGRNMVELARFGEVTGLEPSETSAKVARSRAVGEVVQGSIESLPFEDASFDLAATLDVIEHVDDDRGALRELRRVVRPGGTLLVTVPAYPRLWSSHDEANEHRRRYTRRTLLAAARDAGWSPRRTTHFNLLLLPVAAGYRLVERRLNTDAPPTSELARNPAAFNWLLEQPLRGEAALVRRGRRLPAGLSLMGIFGAAGENPR